jgi:protein-tyrosine-phosphatase
VHLFHALSDEMRVRILWQLRDDEQRKSIAALSQVRDSGSTTSLRCVIMLRHRVRRNQREDVRLQWSFDDPVRAQGSVPEHVRVFRQVRDAIGKQIQGWLRAADQLSESDTTSFPDGS